MSQSGSEMDEMAKKRHFKKQTVALQNTVWFHDLTTEGIEPNPGPTVLPLSLINSVTIVMVWPGRTKEQIGPSSLRHNSPTSLTSSVWLKFAPYRNKSRHYFNVIDAWDIEDGISQATHKQMYGERNKSIE